MTPPFIVFLLTLLCCGFVALHSFWRFLLREQLPSVVHVAMTGGTAFAAWLLLAESSPVEQMPDGRAIVLLILGLLSVAGVHLYELGQSERINPVTGESGVPYDGMFSVFGGRWAPKKPSPPVRKHGPL
jgi:hypothetical protein